MILGAYSVSVGASSASSAASASGASFFAFAFCAFGFFWCSWLRLPQPLRLRSLLCLPSSGALCVLAFGQWLLCLRQPLCLRLLRLRRLCAFGAFGRFCVFRGFRCLLLQVRFASGASGGGSTFFRWDDCLSGLLLAKRLYPAPKPPDPKEHNQRVAVVWLIDQIRAVSVSGSLSFRLGKGQVILGSAVSRSERASKSSHIFSNSRLSSGVGLSGKPSAMYSSTPMVTLSSHSARVKIRSSLPPAHRAGLLRHRVVMSSSTTSPENRRSRARFGRLLKPDLSRR